MQNQIISIFLISFTTLAVIHILALRFFLYWRYEWFDIPMHLFGGAVVALGVFTARELQLPFLNQNVTFQRTLTLVFVTALVWEVFELVGGITILQDTFVFDTLADIIAGLIGGSVGYIAGKSIMQLDI